MTERRRCFLLFETGIPPVTNHHAIDEVGAIELNRPCFRCRPRCRRSRRTAARKSAEDSEVFAIQLFLGPFDFRQTVMRIDHCSRVPGEMFPAAGDARYP